ncbi:MAG: L,D-transpeptidase [Pseudomonadota bacterium]
MARRSLITAFKRSLLAALVAGGPILATQGAAQAGQRYATPPPVTLSPDLTSAWTLQITPRRASRADRWRAKRPRGLKRQRKQTHQAVRVPKKRRDMRTERTGVRLASATRPNNSLRRSITPDFKADLLPTIVHWERNDKPGTIIVNTIERRLYLVMEGGMARRYAVGVGKPGFEWAGTHKVTRKAEWPSWTPPKEMIARERKKGRIIPAFMPGGVENPMGARALYLGSTLYRIHGTNQDWSIGQAVSSGCIRMRNEDVMDLYDRVPVGARVRVI